MSKELIAEEIERARENMLPIDYVDMRMNKIAGEVGETRANLRRKITDHSLENGDIEEWRHQELMKWIGKASFVHILETAIVDSDDRYGNPASASTGVQVITDAICEVYPGVGPTNTYQWRREILTDFLERGTIDHSEYANAMKVNDALELIALIDFLIEERVKEAGMRDFFGKKQDEEE